MSDSALRIAYERPAFTERDAVALAAGLYGLDATVRELPSERDRNFLLTAPGGEFVLKVANAAEPREVLELQDRVLAHLAAHAPAVGVPRVRPMAAGARLATVEAAAGSRHFVRLLTYVPGRLWAEVKPHTPALHRSLGRALGTLDAALAGFEDAAAHRELKWDLARAAWIRDYVPYVPEPWRALVTRSLERFESRVLPVLSGLRSGVIHNDANDHNVIVSPGDPRRREVAGLIDFGDMVHTQTVCELAIAVAYAVMDKPDPVSAAAHVVAGYHETRPLTEPELSVLHDLIVTRLAVSVTNAAYQRGVEPGNEYLTISERPARALLEKLADVPPALAEATFRHACGLPPCARTPAVVDWLTRHRDAIGPVVPVDLSGCDASSRPPLVFDLSVGSPELGDLEELSDVERVTARLFARLEEAGAPAGIGRYGEARLVYTSDLFQGEGNDGPESRTVHLGIDVFMPAGTPLTAPLAGRVHGLANNRAHLDYGPTVILEHAPGGGPAFYTLYGHLSEDSLPVLREGMPVAKGGVIGRIGNFHENGGWAPHVHFEIVTDLLGRKGEFPGVARPSQRDVWMSLCPDANLILRIPEELLAADRMDAAEILAARRRHLGKNLSISYERPLHIVRGRGRTLYDADGRPYLDAVNNVAHVGHSHPRVVRAGQRQMAVLNTNTRYLHELLVRYAERLTATLPEPLKVCFFVCSGSEANELALRLARAHTRRRDVVVLEGAYHGNTAALIDVSPYKHDGPGGEGTPPHVHKVPAPDLYRGPYRRGDPRAAERYAAHVAEAVGIAGARGGAAAFLAEPMLSCAGQIVLPDGYLSAAYGHVREAGGVAIADEVQVGFGRPGTRFWAFETQGVVPDIVTLGKPIGNGHPLGAVVTTPEIAESFANGMEYFNTFGGNPVSCAIGLAVLDVIADEDLQRKALDVGSYLMEGLRGLQERHPVIGDVRGQGLFAGVELVRSRETLEPAGEEAAYVANRMRERGVLLSTDGPFHNVLKIKPPLVFTREDADTLVGTLDGVLYEDFVREPRG